jgi:hypothetical protein
MGSLQHRSSKVRVLSSLVCIANNLSTSTYLGLPPNTVYEGVLGSDFTFLSPHQVPDELVGQLQVAQFCNTFTKSFYCNHNQPNGLIAESERAGALETVRTLYSRLEIALAEHMSCKLL